MHFINFLPASYCCTELLTPFVAREIYQLFDTKICIASYLRLRVYFLLVWFRPAPNASIACFWKLWGSLKENFPDFLIATKQFLGTFIRKLCLHMPPPPHYIGNNFEKVLISIHPVQFMLKLYFFLCIIVSKDFSVIPPVPVVSL